MRKWTKKTEAIFAVALAASLCFTGCNGVTASEQSKQKVFSYDGVDINLDEVWLYADISKAKYESQYGSIFGDSLWTTEVSTDDDGNPVTLETTVKDNVIDQIKHIIVLNNKAEELGISLTDAEIKKAKKSAKAFVKEDEGKAIMEETGANEELIQKLYEQNAIASKVHQKMIEDTNTEVSDEEARQTTIYKLVFPKTKTDEETGETSDMSKKELAQQKKKADEAYEKLQSGTSIEDLAKEYDIESTTDETFEKGESLEGENFETAIYKLKDGETTAVMDTDAGYVIAKLVALTDKDATEEKKSEIIQERQQEEYEREYTEWTKDLEEEWDADKDVDQDSMDKIVFHEETEEDSTQASEATTTATETAEETTQAEETSTEAKADETTAATTASKSTTAASTEKTTAASETTTAKAEASSAASEATTAK